MERQLRRKIRSIWRSNLGSVTGTGGSVFRAFGFVQEPILRELLQMTYLDLLVVFSAEEKAPPTIAVSNYCGRVGILNLLPSTGRSRMQYYTREMGINCYQIWDSEYA